MSYNIDSLLKVFILSLFCVFNISCSKDSDLFADLVLTDSNLAVLVDDIYVVSLNSSVVLDVLSNDNISQEDNVTITETSEPSSGNVEINEDNTITYTPETTEEIVDTFTYTTEVVSENETVSTETAIVTVTVEDPNKTGSGELKAFPTAVGHGRFTSGGRGGDVYYVTNLNADGSGSLQYGLANAPASGRTIIFRVAGWIDHGGSDYLTLNEPNITVAGQTAPGGGIGVRGELRVQDDNVIVRHISVRNDNGWNSTAPAAIRVVAYNGESTENIILDHVSLGWAKDENLTVTSANNNGYINKITVQNCIIDNNLQTGYNVINYWNVTNSTYYQNLLAYGKQRNLASTTCSGSFEFINNMTYSYSGSAMVVACGADFDVIGNVWDTGGYTLPWGEDPIRLSCDENPFFDQNCSGLGKTNPGLAGTDLYYTDNLFNNGPATYNTQTKSRLQTSPGVSSNITTYAASGVQDRIIANGRGI